MATAMNATSTFSCPHNGTAHDGTLLCHWTNSPGGRGTLNIFWLCISTLGLCFWNAVQPDVPRPNTPWWRVFGKRLWWLFVGLFMPEMLVLVALGQFRLACELLVLIDRKNIASTQFPWWMYLIESWRPRHGNLDPPAKRWMKALLRWMEPLLRRLRVPFLADSDAEKGQSVLTGENDPSPPAAAGADDGPAHDSSKSSQQAHNSPRPEIVYHAREHPWTLTHTFYAVIGGFVDKEGHTIALADIHDMSNEVLAQPLHHPERIPDVAMKAGVLAKSLLVWQLFVFLANCFARWDQSLPLSLLEITTIGHSPCSIIAMVLWWYKPHSVGEATVILVYQQGPLPAPSNVERRKIFSWIYFLNAVLVVGGGDTMDLAKTVTIAAIAVLYGLPHLLGLSVHFPTSAEQLCWTIATLMVIGSPLVVCLILWILARVLGGRAPAAITNSLLALLAILLVLYPIGSIFLVGESVRQIFALPVESFRGPQLTYYLPSFS